MIRTSSGRIMLIDKYEFEKETVSGKHIFTVEGLPTLGTVVSEFFKEIVEKNGLEGLIFKKVWEMSED